jgi:hypothetical protein
MSSQTFDLIDAHQYSDTVPSQPSRPAVAWHERRWFKVVMGCCVTLIGLAKVCKGLVLLTGATNYGMVLEFNHADLYYTTAVTREEAKQLGDYLLKQKFFDGRHVSVQLTKEKQTFQVRFPVKADYLKDKSYLAEIRAMDVELSKNVFHGAPVEVHLCDGDFKTLVAVPATAAAATAAK